MAEQSAPAKPADTRIEGAANDVAMKGMTPAVETIQAFAREIAQMSGQALIRTNCTSKSFAKRIAWKRLRRSRRIFFKESMEHAVQHTREHAVHHTRKYFEMLATFPHEPMQPVNMAVEAAEPDTPQRRRSGGFPRLPIKLKVTASPAVVSEETLRRAGIERCLGAKRNRVAQWGQRMVSASPILM